jgi:hypothetical protein
MGTIIGSPSGPGIPNNFGPVGVKSCPEAGPPPASPLIGTVDIQDPCQCPPGIGHIEETEELGGGISGFSGYSGFSGAPGGGGGGPEAATFVVSPTPGVGDFTTIQEALDALPSEGGYILVREGTYPLTLTNTMPDKPVVIRGCGDATVINLGANAIAAFTIPDGLTTFRDYVFEDFKVVGTSIASQQIWNIRDSQSFGVVHGTRVNSSGVQAPAFVFVSDSSAGVPVTIYLDDCSFVPLADGTGILIDSENGAQPVTNAYMQNVRFYDPLTSTTGGALTNGGFFSDQTGVNIIGSGCTFSIVTDNTMGSLALEDSFIGVASGVVTDTHIITIGDPNQVIQSSLISCTAMDVIFFPGGNGLHVSGGVYNGCFFSDGADFCSFYGVEFQGSPNADSLIDGNGRTVVEGCLFFGHGNLAVLTGNFASIIGNFFNDQGSDAVIKINNNVSVIADNRFVGNSVPAILETGSTSTARIDNNFWTTPPTLLAGTNAIVNGIRQKSVDAVDTTDAFVNVFTHTNAKGMGGGGSIKNTGPNTLTYRVEVTDPYGTVATQSFDVLSGASDFWRMDSVFTGALPSYVSFGISVQSKVAGVPTTFSLRHSSDGAY